MARKPAQPPMGLNSREKVDYGAVRLARKKANINNTTTTGTNTANPGVSLKKPTAKSGNSQPLGKGQPPAPKAANALYRRKRA